MGGSDLEKTPERLSVQRQLSWPRQQPGISSTSLGLLATAWPRLCSARPSTALMPGRKRGISTVQNVRAHPCLLLGVAPIHKMLEKFSLTLARLGG